MVKQILNMSNITKTYDIGEEKQQVLKGINFSVEEGEFVAILGPSGSGKSTLMNIIGCLDTATSGSYELDGKNINEFNEKELAKIRNQNIGFIFQSFQLLPRLNAIENVELPLIYEGIKFAKRKEIFKVFDLMVIKQIKYILLCYNESVKLLNRRVKMNKVKENKKVDFKDLREVFHYAVKKYAKNTAFIIKKKIDGKVQYINKTYENLKNEVEELGTGLINMGLKGKRIAIISPNRYEWCMSYLSVVNGVGIVIPLDKSLPEREIALSLKQSLADCVIFDSKYEDIMKKIKNAGDNNIKSYICMDKITDSSFISLQNVIEKGKELLKNGNKEYSEAEIKADEMSIILFTSGTTSSSKAVMLSHKNITENINALNIAEDIYETDVALLFLPLHHTFGSTGYLLFMSNGVTCTFCDGLKHIPQNLKEYKVSIFVCVPLLLEAMYKKINIEIKKQGKTKLISFAKKLSNLLLKFGIDIRRKIFKQILDNLGGNLRFVVSGAAAIDKEVAKGFNEFGILTVQGYGLTETSPVITAETKGNIKYGSVGFPLSNVEVKIDNPNEQGIGEVIMKGPNLMLGYYENEEATNEVIVDGWFHTGDLGYIDKDGYLFITGRKKNVIVLKNGKNIYPEEIEQLVNNLPYVAESMVFGYPKDDDLIISVKIVYNEDYIKDIGLEGKEAELQEKVWKDIKNINSQMPNYKHMKKLILTKEPMIKTTTQKIKRFEEISKVINEKS